MTRVKFAALLAALIIGCTSVGFAASYYLNSMWYAVVEPIVYPCPYPGNSGTCLQYPNQPDPDAAVWFYGWPSMDPTHIHYQPQRSCILDFLYHDPFAPGTLRGGQQ